MTDNIAIAHDQFYTMGGAERVACEMARMFDAPIYTMHVDPEAAPDDIDIIDVSSKLGTVAMASHYLVQDLYQMLAWQHVPELYEYDIVIQDKMNPMWFVPRDDQTVIRYLHSTPRGLYDQFWRRGRGVLSRLIKTPQRPLFRPNVSTADAWACNSELVQRRMELYWDLDPDEVSVIYPAVPTSEFSADTAPTQDYYFIVSRLHGHKRIEHAVQAANEAGVQLVVAGDGPRREHLERIAGPTVDILGYIPEAEKQRRMSEAKAFVMTAENEDFGITPIEAMAAGTPVIGVDEGFTQYQIKDGCNGLRYERGVQTLSAALSRFEHDGVQWSSARIEQFAEQFSRERFREQVRALVERAIANSEIAVPWGADERGAPAAVPDVAAEEDRTPADIATTDGGINQ